VVSTLIEDYPNFVVVEYQINNQWEQPWGRDRSFFYDVWASGFPWFAYDGLFDAWPIANFEPALIDRLAVPTDVTMTITGSEVAADSFDFSVEVCIETGGAGKTMRIYVVQVLDKFPTTETYFRNTFKQAAATEDVTLTPGECTLVERNFIFDADSMARPTDIRVLAWAQEPLDGIPAEIHQGAQSDWPFVDLAVFDDGFDDGTMGNWSATTQ
jgi:hypothetical protein